MIKKYWWKLLSLILLLYAVTYGFFVYTPDLPVVHESIRNLFYHVGMWFGMFTMLTVSFVYSLKYLKGFDEKNDRVAIEAVNVGLMFGFLGIFTGMIWANFTWGAPWVKDPKLNGAAVGLVIYLAYIILRSSVEDRHKRAKVSAVYNIFAFVLWIIFVLVLPKIATNSMHPGAAGKETTVLPMHMDSSMRTVFYPAVIGWILLGTWILQIRIRMSKIKDKIEEN